jgi:hypothetical protein
MMTKQKRHARLSSVGGFAVLAFVLVCACFTLLSRREWRPVHLAGPLDGHRLNSLRPSQASAFGQNLSAPILPIIDPVLVYSTFLGGPGGGDGQQATAMLVDAAGNVYVAGTTDSQSFPTTAGVVQPSPPPGVGAFVSKIDPTGKTLIFSTYVPGLYALNGFALDASGNIYVAGPTAGLSIPSGTTPFQGAQRSIGIVKLNSTATAVLNATYLGGSGSVQGPPDQVAGIAVDSAGSVYVTGFTGSNDFPTLNALQGSLGTSGSNGFVTKLDSSLSTLLYSTYLGGNSTGSGSSIAVDSSRNAYVAGTANAGFPTTAGAAKATCGSYCSYLAKLNTSASGGSSLLYSTFLAEQSNANVVTVDINQNSYVGGNATGGTATLGTCSGGVNGFLAEINAAGAIPFSACLGYFQEGGDRGVVALNLDASGTLYVGGIDFGLPLTNPIQTNSTAQALLTSWVAAINPGTNSLLFSSLIGGAQPGEADTITGVGVDSNGNIYAAGGASSADLGQTPPFPVFNALQPLPGAANTCLRCGSGDAFILKIAPTNAPAAALSPAGLTFGTQTIGTPTSPQAVTVIDLGSAALTVSNATATGDFSVQNNCSMVTPAGGSCTMSVTFTPTAAGERTGTLTITDNSAGSPRTVPLTGEGGQGSAQILPGSLSFPNQAVGTTSAAQTVTLTNPGTLPLEISHIKTANPFAETNNCGTSVQPAGSCTISVTFAPTAAGSASGVLTLMDSASDSPQSVALTGDTGGSGSGSGGESGAPPSVGLGVASGGSASATVAAGSTATYSLSIGGAGISGNASLTCTGTPTGSTCSIPGSLSLSASTPSTFNVSVATTARSRVWLIHFDRPLWLWALAVFACLSLMGAAGATQSMKARWELAPLLALTMCACSGGNSPTPTPSPTPSGTSAGTYTIVVTAKTASSTQSQNLTLVVK